jgi:TonB family protein
MQATLSVTFLWLLLLASILTAQQADEPPVDLSPAAAQGLLVKTVPPIYPPLARQARIQGTVVLLIVIGKAGEVRDVRLMSGHPMLAPAAIKAVKQWKYQPYQQGGQAIEVATNVSVSFRLPEAGFVSQPAYGVDSPLIRSDEGVVPVSEFQMRQLRTEKVEPVYPALAVQARIQDTVVLEVQVNAAGDVENVKLVSGHPLLVKVSIEAVKQWKYSPYVQNGNGTPFVGVVRLNFTMGTGDDGGIVSEPAIVENLPPSSGFPRGVRISSGVSQTFLLRKVDPEYPPEAKDEHIEGVVRLEVNIDREGNVSNLEPISGDPALAAAAIEAVRQWKYRPYLLHGEPVEVDTQVEVNFRLAE